MQATTQIFLQTFSVECHLASVANGTPWKVLPNFLFLNCLFLIWTCDYLCAMAALVGHASHYDTLPPFDNLMGSNGAPQRKGHRPRRNWHLALLDAGGYGKVGHTGGAAHTPGFFILRGHSALHMEVVYHYIAEVGESTFCCLALTVSISTCNACIA